MKHPILTNYKRKVMKDFDEIGFGNTTIYGGDKPVDVKSFIKNALDDYTNRLKEEVNGLTQYPASGSRTEKEYLISKSEVLDLLGGSE